MFAQYAPRYVTDFEPQCMHGAITLGCNGLEFQRPTMGSRGVSGAAWRVRTLVICAGHTQEKPHVGGVIQPKFEHSLNV